METDNRKLTVRPAISRDVQGIKDLLVRNSFKTLTDEEKKDGWVSGDIPTEKLREYLSKDQFLCVMADENNRVIGVTMGNEWDFLERGLSPIIDRMTEVLGECLCHGEKLTHENSYLYGPICLDVSFRSGGRGTQLFEFHFRQAADRYKYSTAFIHGGNVLSQSFHSKMGFEKVGSYEANDHEFAFIVQPV